MAARSRSTTSSQMLPSALHRSLSPSGRLASSSPSFFSRSASPARGLSFAGDRAAGSPPDRRKTCVCSPTTHPGSFRCSLHKGPPPPQSQQHRNPMSSRRLNARRSAMTNSLVRIGTVEGDLVKRALAALVRPCAHQQRRRLGFQRRPSRLSVMSKADDRGV